jgi:hypothetical protein
MILSENGEAYIKSLSWTTFGKMTVFSILLNCCHNIKHNDTRHNGNQHTDTRLK